MVENEIINGTLPLVIRAIGGQERFDIINEREIIMNVTCQDNYWFRKRKTLLENEETNEAPVVTVYLKVKDCNNHDPTFAQPLYFFSIPENSKPGTIIGTVSATDIDESDLPNTISYSLDAIDPKSLQYFTMKENSIYTSDSSNKTIDYEAGVHSFHLAVVARNNRPSVYPAAGFTRVPLVITITDVDDNPAEFIQQKFVYTLYPDVETVGNLIVQDFDSKKDANSDLKISTNSEILENLGKFVIFIYYFNTGPGSIMSVCLSVCKNKK
jgi:hypothetical protein